jgi:hypothetical protein
MKIKTNTILKYRVIDFINARSWMFLALSSTILALFSVWSIGIFALTSIS